jgi:HlyD family secretion protein
MKHKLIITIILLGVISGIAWFHYFKTEQKDDKTIKLTGNVDIRQVDLSFRVNGRIDKMIPEEGDSVSAGQVIAMLDKEPYQDEVNQAKASLKVQQARLNELLAGTRYERIKQAKARVEELKANLENLKTISDKYNRGFEAGVISKQQQETSELQIKEAEARLKLANDQLEEAINGPRKQDIDAARASVEAARATLDQTERQYSYTVLDVPSDSVILTRVKEPGAVVQPGETVYTLSINSPKWVKSYIDETRLGKIYPGMQAKISTDSYPDKTYEGQIGFISPEAEFTPKSVETEELRTSLVYRLRVIVQDPENQLRQGMPVTVRLYPDKQKETDKISSSKTSSINRISNQNETNTGKDK